MVQAEKTRLIHVSKLCVFSYKQECDLSWLNVSKTVLSWLIGVCLALHFT
jgi:hypothetical protein